MALAACTGHVEEQPASTAPAAPGAPVQETNVLGTPPDVAERWANDAPLRRNGEPSDVAQTVVFLCGGPSFITGQVLRVDGGKSLV